MMMNPTVVFVVLWLLQTSLSLAKPLSGDGPINVNFCCPDGEVLKIRNARENLLGGINKIARCVRSRGVTNTLEGVEVSFLSLVQENESNQTKLIKRPLTKLGEKKPSCERGLQISKLNIHQEDGAYSQHDADVTIELRGFNSSVDGIPVSEGNVYIDGKPICDDGWDKNAAIVACRMLGYSDGEPTQQSAYGEVYDTMAMDDIGCIGDETSLYNCAYSSYTDCGAMEGAGVVCSHTDVSTVMGKLQQLTEEFEADEFCLAENWEHVENDDDGYYQEWLNGFHGTLGLSCDQCLEEVFCFYVRMFFDYMSRGKKTIYRSQWDVLKNNAVNIGDQNGDNEVDFEEFKSKFVEYLTIAFNTLDTNNDGSIDEVLGNHSLHEYSLQFFENLLKNIVEFFDNNEDESISTEDFIPAIENMDTNEDGQVSLYELIGLSLINLPAPIYTAYTLLDENQDEQLSMDEMLDFLTRTLTKLDQNGDCYINLEEIVNALDESGLPWDFQLGIKLVGQQYLTIAKYFIDQVVGKSDTNEDTKITLEEILQLSDFSLIDSSIHVALSMGDPNMGVVSYLTGSRHANTLGLGDKALVAWLTTLHTFLDSPVYKDQPASLCAQ